MKFSKYPLVYLVTLIFVCLSFCNLNAQQPAFPSAKGAGGYASGGRGGQVIHVTTLDWEAEGGLKQALLTTGPRTIVFDVSGEIDASTEPQWEYLLDGSNYDNLTIAGQTAPLGGITIKTSQFFIHNLDNVIIRYIRFRRSASSGFNSSALWLRGCTNVIVDHCSLSHGGDETFDLSSSDGTSANTTIQNCFFQDSQKGMILGTDTRNEATVLDDLGNFTLVDNVFMNIDHRFPNPQGNGQYDIINNIVYNWKNRLIRITQEGTYNILNNYYKTADDGLRRPGWFVGDAVIVNQLQKIQAQPEDNPLIYTAGNIITGQRETPQTDDRDMWTYFAGSHASFPENDLAADNFFTTTQFPLIGKSYTIKTAQETYDDLLTDVGTNKTLNADGTINNYLDSKDESDILVIKNDEFVSVDANFTYPSASDVPYPVIPENLRPSDFYVSNPHIPEAYFLANVPSGEDHNDFAPSGYTWLEEYLNGVDQSSLPPVSVESVVVTPNPSEILISETLQLTKTISPANANNQNGTWSSSDEDIATVDENGLVTPISVGVVVITFTTSDGSFTDTSQITVFPDALLASAGADQQICEGESTTLTATGGTSYLWSTGETTSSIEVSPLTLTSYTVIVSDDYSQSEDVSVTVTVNALPSVDLGEDQIICEGESVTLIANGGTSYLWSTGETTASIEVSPISDTTYSVEVSENNCSSTDEVIITVNTAPTLAVSEDIVIVTGESTTLTASGSTTYDWSTGETSASIIVSPLVTTTYSVSSTAVGGCVSNIETVTVTVIPEIIADVNEDETICSGETVTLTATGGTSYLWNTGETTASLEVSPTVTTTYTVTVEDDYGYTDTSEVTITVNTAPTLAVSEDIVIVTGESTTLTASGSTTYDWSTGETSSSIIVSPLVTTTYSVNSTAVGGCVSNTETITVTVIPEIIADVNEDETICSGDTVTLTATGGTSYLWNTGETTATIEVSPNVTTTYTVTVEDDYGYTDTSEVTITVNTAPTLTASEDIVIVTGESATLTASGSTTYDWSTGETSASIIVSPLVTTTYSVNSTVVGGCVSNTETITVTVIPEIIADVNEDETICSGETVTLTATGGTSYLWNTGETTATIEVSPTVTTTYTVTAEDDYGYTDSVEVTVNVNEMPNITVNDDVFVMIGNAITLTANGGNTYAWNTGDTTSQITVNPVVTTTYTVTGTSVGGCQNTDEVTVTVVDELTANAGEDASICLGESIMLNASGGLTYTWNTGGTGASPVVSPIETTTYSVTVTDGFGNSATDDVVITVNSMPTANAGNDEVICEGESVILTAEGGDSYLWSTGATTASITVNPVLDITYSVEVFSNACSDIDEVSVFVQPTPEITLTQDLVIMNGNSATLEVSGAESYLWNTGDTSNSILVNPTVTTTYNVTGFSASNCEASAEVTVTVVPEVNANAGNDVAICIGESVTLNASGGINYSWNTGDTNTSMTVSPTETTTYTVTVTDDLGNSDSDSVTVTVNELPTLILTEDVTIFEGESISLTVNGAESYLWNTGDTSNSIVVNPTITSTYSVTGFSSSNCETSAEVTVTVIPEINANAGSDVTICVGESVTLTASGGINYSWNTGDTNTSIIVSPIETTTYTVTVTDDLGNSDSDSVTVTVNELPTLILTEDVTIFEGESINLTVNGAESYLWNTGDTSNSIVVNPTITSTYSVTGFSASNCEASAEVTVTVIPEVNANAGNDVAICVGESVTLTASGGINYSWNTGETNASMIVSPIETTTYTVTVTDDLGNSDSDSVTVTVNELPTLLLTEDVTIFEGESINLTVNGAESYLWNTGDTSNSIVVNPTITSTYSVTGFSSSNCEASAEVTVTVIPEVNANAGNDVAICLGESVTLTASGGINYSWNTGETNASMTVSPTETTTYTVTVTDDLGNSDSDSVTVTVNELPLISSSENITIIEGESTDLIVNGAVAYLWNTGDTSSSITVSPTQTTIYSVVGISNTCTSEPSEIIVTVIPLFQASAGTDSRVCDNESYEVILTATEGDSYLWSTGETTQSIVVNPLSTTSYSVTVSEGIQEASDEVMVYVDPSPNVVIANGESVEILSGDFITLSASGANTYEWNNGASQPNIAVSPSVTTTYVVKGYIGQCLDEQQIIVNVIPKVVADAGEDVLICVDDLVTLTATGGDEYVWNTGETTSSISVSPLETTDYTVTVFNALDFDEATVRVEVDLNCTTDTIDNPNEETLEVALDIYPNPANGFVNIKLSGSLIVSDVHIFDVTGKRVKQIRITNDDSNLTTTAQVDISALQSGIYFVKLIDENNNITKKLIVN